MLLSFPHMHPILFPAAPVPGLRFFDPGMTDAVSENGFRPEGLPLDPKTAASLIRDCISFGEQFKDPAEMAYFGAMTPDEFYDGTPSSIQAQLLQRFGDGEGAVEERAAKAARAQAQFVLLLAWFFEEKMIELQGLEQGVRDSWKSMDATLGLDDEDRAEERMIALGQAHSHTGGVSDGQTVVLPWQRMIEALPVFLPGDTVLVCADQGVIASWLEDGTGFEPADPKLGLPQGARVATLPAWRLAGRRKASEAMPAAARDLCVAIIS
jgi:hypothetical protein